MEMLSRKEIGTAKFILGGIFSEISPFEKAMASLNVSSVHAVPTDLKVTKGLCVDLLKHASRLVQKEQHESMIGGMSGQFLISNRLNFITLATLLHQLFGALDSLFLLKKGGNKRYIFLLVMLSQELLLSTRIKNNHPNPGISVYVGAHPTLLFVISIAPSSANTKKASPFKKMP
jgi:hypothetical protein